MSAGLKQMKEHVKAVRNIKKITQSMKVVAAAKFSKSEKTLRLSKSLGMGAMYFYTLSKFREELSVLNTSVFAITSDRGLCGSMHARVCKQVKSHVKSLKQKSSIVCIGEKAKAILQFELSSSITLIVNGIGHRAPSFMDASKIVSRAFKPDEFMQGDLIYAKYKNMVSFEVDKIELYSLRALLTAKGLLAYELDGNEDLLSFLEFSQVTIMYYALCQTYLVELSSRIMAMSNASKNAESMAIRLQLGVNRKRQSAITNELIDIVSGAQVVVGK